MLEKPNLPDDKIVSSLRDSYGIVATELEFLPIGNDSSAGVYRVGSNAGPAYFLKVKKGYVDEVGVAVPRYLYDAGVTSVVAPLPTTYGEELSVTIDDYSLILYPFIRGQSANKVGLSDPQWVEFGKILRQVHSTHLSDDLRGRVPQETFVSSWCRGARNLLATFESAPERDYWSTELADIWRERRDQITQIVDRTDELGRELRSRTFEYVLCHTDPHTANVLVDLDGQLHIVDWDAPLVAPKERDLHFAIANVITSLLLGPREEELIFKGYGPTTLDWVALTYFRYEWVCGDLFEYGRSVFGPSDAGELEKHDAVRRVRHMFEPGGAVASAYEVDRRRAELSGSFNSG